MEQNFRIATDLGYLTYDPSRIVAKDKIKDVPDDKLVIATTGAQGEPMAGLARMANRDHRFVEIQPGDTVIVSASPIPGNEEYVSPDDRQPVQGRRERLLPHDQARPRVRPREPGRAEADARPDEAEVLHPDPRRVPDAGPARPPGDRDRRRAGERLHHRERHADRDLSPTAPPGAATPVPAGYVFVDGLSVGEVGEIVLRDRRALANDGMFMIVVTVDKQTGNVVGRPEIITRGFVHLNEQDPIMDEAIERVIAVDPEPRATTSARSPCSRARSRTACRATCTSRRSAARWSSRSWSRSDVATRRRTTRRTSPTPAPPAVDRLVAAAGPGSVDLGLAGRRPLARRDLPAGPRRGHADRPRRCRARGR